MSVKLRRPTSWWEWAFHRAGDVIDDLHDIGVIVDLGPGGGAHEILADKILSLVPETYRNSNPPPLEDGLKYGG